MPMTVKERLQDLRHELSETIARDREQLAPCREDAMRDPADIASDLIARERLLEIDARLRRDLAEVDETFRRLASGHG